MTLVGGELEAVTHAGYTELDLAFDLGACQGQLEQLNGGRLGLDFGATITAPGAGWIADMTARVEWLLKAVQEQEQHWPIRCCKRASRITSSRP